VTATRTRILDAGADLFRRQGYAATGVKQIVTAAQAPFGSIYHHFPGGKEQLGAEAIRVSGELYAMLLPLVFDPAPDLVSGVRAFFAGAAAHLQETDYEDACPIATITLETASRSESMRRASHDVFESWISAGLPYATAAGLSEPVARELIIFLLSALEGGFLLARAARSTEALHVAGERVAEAAETALARAAVGGGSVG
jgi:AcrR family transcriptional regulator